jgi:NRPS condensation-like uncharacterized protein
MDITELKAGLKQQLLSLSEDDLKEMRRMLVNEEARRIRLNRVEPVPRKLTVAQPTDSNLAEFLVGGYRPKPR